MKQCEEIHFKALNSKLQVIMHSSRKLHFSVPTIARHPQGTLTAGI